MPIEKSPELLTRFVSAAVENNQQISDALDEVGYDLTELQQDISKQGDRVFEVAANEIRKYEAEESDIVATEGQLNSEFSAQPEPYSRFFRIKPVLFAIGLWICGIYAISLTFIGIYHLINDWPIRSLYMLTTWSWILAFADAAHLADRKSGSAELVRSCNEQ